VDCCFFGGRGRGAAGGVRFSVSGGRNGRCTSGVTSANALTCSCVKLPKDYALSITRGLWSNGQGTGVASGFATWVPCHGVPSEGRAPGVRVRFPLGSHWILSQFTPPSRIESASCIMWPPVGRSPLVDLYGLAYFWVGDRPVPYVAASSSVSGLGNSNTALSLRVSASRRRVTFS
jgi:hypothetical protein